MRVAVHVFLLLLFATSCTTPIAPRQYLDEETAATITVAASPWIFVSDDPRSAFDRRGFLNLYTLDVNRAGAHQRYFAAVQSSFDVVLPDEKSTPTLELQADGRKLVFQSTSQTLQQLGFTQPLEQPIASQSRWWYYPVTEEEIASVAQLQNPRASLATNDAQFTYVEFRNGSKELSELLVTLR